MKQLSAELTWVMLNHPDGSVPPRQVSPGQREAQQRQDLKPKYELPAVKSLSVSRTVPISHKQLWC